MKFEWEEIWNNENVFSYDWWEATYRAKVPGGWLIKHETAHDDISENADLNIRRNEIIFISDVNHAWIIENI